MPWKRVKQGAALLGLLVWAQTAAADPALLGTKLTPLGSDPSASTDGMIPAWKGGITKPPAGYERGGDHIDPFASDKRLFTITAANADRYADRLSAGQRAMLAAYPDTYKIHVYPSRRSCALPEAVYEATRKNASSARLTENGNNVEGALMGVPFPVPESAQEVMWNHNFYYHGHRYQARITGGTVFPDGRHVRVVRDDKRWNFYTNPDTASSEDLDNSQFYWTGIWSAPSNIAGSGFSMINSINQYRQPRHGHMFRPDIGKIVRASSGAVTYDAPMQSAMGLRISDDMFLYNGSPDLYEWRLIGKRAMVIPYNVYAATHTGVALDDILTPRHLNPELIRHEMHRVWVVEATLKEGKAHPYARRRFYADEDSWILVGVDIYDEKGDLVRVQQGYIKNYYEHPACLLEFDALYDLPSGRYNIDNLKVEFGPADLDADISLKDFGSTALQQAITR